MDVNLIGLIITGIVLGVLIISTIVGLIVGFKQSLSKAIFNLVLSVLLLFIAPIVAQKIINLDLNAYGINLDGAVTLKEYIINYINSIEGLQGMVESCPSLISVIEQIPAMIVSPIIFAVTFWVIKILVFVVEFIVGIFVGIFRLASKKQKNKVKKHHLVGALVGFVSGLVLLFATFVPIFGFSNVLMQLSSLETAQTEQQTSEVQSLSYTQDTNETSTPSNILGDNTEELINALNNNFGAKLIQYTGVKKLSEVSFNYLTKSEVNGTSIKLAEEVESLYKVFSGLQYFASLDFNTATQEEIGLALNKVNQIIKDTFEMKLIRITGDELLPYVANSLKNDTFIVKLPKSENENINSLVNATLTIISTYKTENLQENLNQVVNIATTLNDNNLIVAFRDAETLDVNSIIVILKNTNQNFSENLSSSILNIDIIQNITPEIVNSALSEISKALQIEYSNQEITKETAKNFMQNILKNSIDLIKTLNPNKDYYITQASFNNIGKVLNEFLNEDVVPSQTYTNIIDKLISLINNFAQNLPFDLSQSVNNIKDVNNWQTEMQSLSQAFLNFETIYDEYKTNNNIQDYLQNGNIEVLGELLNSLSQTKIFENVVDIYNSAIEYLASSLTSFENSVNTLKISQSNVNFKNELKAIQPLLSEMFALVNEDISSTSSITKILDICSIQDQIENDPNSEIFSAKMQPLLLSLLNDFKNLSSNAEVNSLIDKITAEFDNRGTQTIELTVCKGMFKYASTLIPNSSTFEQESIKNMITSIKNKIDQINNNTLEINYRNEFDYMLKFADNIDNFKNIDALTSDEQESLMLILDELENSAIFADCKTYLVDLIVEKANEVIESYSDNIGLSSSLNDIKENILENVSLSTFINDINTVKSVAQSILNETNNLDSMNTENLANSLNTIKNTQSFGTSFTNSILKNVLNNINTNVQSNEYILEDKKTEVSNYVNEKIEFLTTSSTIEEDTYLNILNGIYSIINN